MRKDEQRYRGAVTENMLRVLEGGGEKDLRSLRESQAALVAWLCDNGYYDESAEQCERMTAIDEHLLRSGGPATEDLQNAVDDYLRFGSVLSVGALNGDPIRPYTRALEIAAMLKKVAPEAAAIRAGRADYGIACALWGQGRYDESLIRCRLAEEEAGLAAVRETALCDEMEKCFASVAGALNVPDDRGAVLTAWENILRGGVLPDGDGSTDDLALLAAYLDAVAAALMALGNIKGGIAEYRRSIFWVRSAILHRRSRREDHEALYKALMTLADALDADENEEDSVLMKKLALRLKNDELEEKKNVEEE